MLFKLSKHINTKQVAPKSEERLLTSGDETWGAQRQIGGNLEKHFILQS